MYSSPSSRLPSVPLLTEKQQQLLLRYLCISNDEASRLLRQAAIQQRHSCSKRAFERAVILGVKRKSDTEEEEEKKQNEKEEDSSSGAAGAPRWMKNSAVITAAARKKGGCLSSLRRAAARASCSSPVSPFFAPAAAAAAAPESTTNSFHTKEEPPNWSACSATALQQDFSAVEVVARDQQQQQQQFNKQQERTQAYRHRLLPPPLAGAPQPDGEYQREKQLQQQQERQVFFSQQEQQQQVRQAVLSQQQQRRHVCLSQQQQEQLLGNSHHQPRRRLVSLNNAASAVVEQEPPEKNASRSPTTTTAAAAAAAEAFVSPRPCLRRRSTVRFRSPVAVDTSPRWRQRHDVVEAANGGGKSAALSDCTPAARGAAVCIDTQEEKSENTPLFCLSSSSSHVSSFSFSRGTDKPASCASHASVGETAVAHPDTTPQLVDWSNYPRSRLSQSCSCCSVAAAREIAFQSAGLRCCCCCCSRLLYGDAQEAAAAARDTAAERWAPPAAAAAAGERWGPQAAAAAAKRGESPPAATAAAAASGERVTRALVAASSPPQVVPSTADVFCGQEKEEEEKRERAMLHCCCCWKKRRKKSMYASTLWPVLRCYQTPFPAAAPSCTNEVSFTAEEEGQEEKEDDAEEEKNPSCAASSPRQRTATSAPTEAGSANACCRAGVPLVERTAAAATAAPPRQGAEKRWKQVKSARAETTGLRKKNEFCGRFPSRDVKEPRPCCGPGMSIKNGYVRQLPHREEEDICCCCCCCTQHFPAVDSRHTSSLILRSRTEQGKPRSGFAACRNPLMAAVAASPVQGAVAASNSAVDAAQQEAADAAQQTAAADTTDRQQQAEAFQENNNFTSEYTGNNFRNQQKQRHERQRPPMCCCLQSLDTHLQERHPRNFAQSQLQLSVTPTTATTVAEAEVVGSPAWSSPPCTAQSVVHSPPLQLQILEQQQMKKKQQHVIHGQQQLQAVLQQEQLPQRQLRQQLEQCQHCLNVVRQSPRPPTGKEPQVILPGKEDQQPLQGCCRCLSPSVLGKMNACGEKSQQERERSAPSPPPALHDNRGKSGALRLRCIYFHPAAAAAGHAATAGVGDIAAGRVAAGTAVETHDTHTSSGERPAASEAGGLPRTAAISTGARLTPAVSVTTGAAPLEVQKGRGEAADQRVTQRAAVAAVPAAEPASIAAAALPEVAGLWDMSFTNRGKMLLREENREEHLVGSSNSSYELRAASADVQSRADHDKRNTFQADDAAAPLPASKPIGGTYGGGCKTRLFAAERASCRREEEEAGLSLIPRTSITASDTPVPTAAVASSSSRAAGAASLHMATPASAGGEVSNTAPAVNRSALADETRTTVEQHNEGLQELLQRQQQELAEQLRRLDALEKRQQHLRQPQLQRRQDWWQRLRALEQQLHKQTTALKQQQLRGGVGEQQLRRVMLERPLEIWGEHQHQLQQQKPQEKGSAWSVPLGFQQHQQHHTGAQQQRANKHEPLSYHHQRQESCKLPAVAELNRPLYSLPMEKCFPRAFTHGKSCSGDIYRNLVGQRKQLGYQHVATENPAAPVAPLLVLSSSTCKIQPPQRVQSVAKEQQWQIQHQVKTQREQLLRGQQRTPGWQQQQQSLGAKEQKSPHQAPRAVAACSVTRSRVDVRGSDQPSFTVESERILSDEDTEEQELLELQDICETLEAAAL